MNVFQRNCFRFLVALLLVGLLLTQFCPKHSSGSNLGIVLLLCSLAMCLVGWLDANEQVKIARRGR
jgi:UDP-N-acetylmuramyl pentapeptide phosphotransferase/UDP-N-acetylglucosamine-1-phosphate transferase